MYQHRNTKTPAPLRRKASFLCNALTNGRADCTDYNHIYTRGAQLLWYGRGSEKQDIRSNVFLSLTINVNACYFAREN